MYFERGQGQHYITGTNIYGVNIITYTKNTHSAVLLYYVVSYHVIFYYAGDEYYQGCTEYG